MKYIKYAKEIGIVVSYLWLFIAVFLFNRSPFSIFIVYFLELIVILIVYCINRLLVEKKYTNIYISQPPLTNVLIGSIPILIFQYFLIGLVADFIQPELHFFTGKQMLFTKNNAIILLTIFILYVMKLFQIKEGIERDKVLKYNILYQALSLTATNLVGAITVLVLGLNSLLPILALMVAIRIFLEIYFNRKVKII